MKRIPQKVLTDLKENRVFVNTSDCRLQDISIPVQCLKLERTNHNRMDFRINFGLLYCFSFGFWLLPLQSCWGPYALHFN